MPGLDCLGAQLGIEGLDIAKMFGGLLSGTGGMMSAGSRKPDDSKAAEKQRIEDDRRRAEQSASRLKLGLGLGGAATLAAVALFLVRR